jgi:putative DNA primase/helicase
LDEEQFEPEGQNQADQALKEEVGFTCMADVESKEATWLWEGRIPLGNITLLEGDPSTGKSTILASLIASVTRGDPGFAEGKVILMASEDSLREALRPKLDAAGAVVEKVFCLAESLILSPKTGIPKLRRLIEIERPILVAIDPIFAYVGDGLDMYRDSDVRKILTPLKAIAEEFGVTLICVRHLTKNGGAKAIYAGGGSIAFTAAARSMLMTGRTPEGQSILFHSKCNVGPQRDALLFDIETTEVNIEGNLRPVSRIRWGGEIRVSEGDFLGVQGETRAPRRNEAGEFLVNLLREAPRSVTVIRNECDAVDISFDTVREAKRRHGGIHHGKQPGSLAGEWYWWLLSNPPEWAHLLPENNPQ